MTYDTETDPFHWCSDTACKKCGGKGRVPQPFLHGLYNGATEEYLEFESIEKFIEHIQQQRALVYAHNGGKFDYHPLRQYFNTDEPIMLINGRIARFRIGAAEFRDSLNIFPNTRLSDFGVKTEIDYSKMEPETRVIPEVKKEISLYMKQDCVGLWEQVDRYRLSFGKGLTQAGTSMKYWEKHHWKDKAPRQTRTQFLRCKPFYYGGRVQCFEQGNCIGQEFEVADINSAYPRAMLEAHPISPAAEESDCLPRGEQELQTCLIRLRATAKGCFPWRDQKGSLYFPEDEGVAPGVAPKMREYTITGWEFLTALELDAVKNIQVLEVLSFAKVVSFKDYIEEHYKARLQAIEQGDLAGKTFRKYMMNGIYGKFGADPSHYAEYVIATTDTLDQWKAQGYQLYQDWGGGRYLMERQPTDDDLMDMTSRWRYYNVATAASITGYVRAFLFRSMMKAEGLIYCDTDSIAAKNLKGLDYGKELGQWKHEGHFDRYSIAGKKLYAFHKLNTPLDYNPTAPEKDRNWKIASKGVGLHLLPDGPTKMAELAIGKTVSFTPEVPTYSVTREQPIFITREIKSTAKDIRIAPDEAEPIQKVNRTLTEKVGLKPLASHLYLA